ncbi:MAG: DNA cytosine methyltransferase [Fusobacterium sp.]|nr:DNA cytosine methyltransferase [Fusobacterium sp.]
MNKYKAISLFAGIGGICLGFKNAGVDIVFANDFDKNACITYRNNFNHGIIEGPIENIKTENIPDADMVLFGFPCTSFSIAGKRAGFEDEKSGHLFFEALRVIKAKKPRVFFLENVKNLVSHDSGNTFKVITDCLKKEGYYFRYKVLNSMEYGNVPQNRERIYMVGFKNKEECDRFYFPDPIPLTKTIKDIIKKEEKKDSKFYYENSKYYPMLKESMINKDSVYQLRRVYVRENKKGVCPTLTANMGTGGHNVPLVIDDFGIRKLTPRETLLLQGFPEDYKIPEKMANSHLYKQAGNSVTVTVIERIAKNIIKALNN